MRIAALALICMGLYACASTPVDAQSEICGVLTAMAADSSETHLSPEQNQRMGAIPRGDLASDVPCDGVVYTHSAPQGLMYVGVGFDPTHRYAAVQTHYSDGQYFVAGNRCLLRRRGNAWRKLGCSPLYIS